jgi:hypothetical protein
MPGSARREVPPTWSARARHAALSRHAIIHRVTFDETLAHLLSLVGQPVTVAVDSPAAGLVAQFSGRLDRGHELAGDERDAPVFFSFDDGGSGFVLVRATFASARLSEDGSLVRVTDTAGVAVTVERTPPVA